MRANTVGSAYNTTETDIKSMSYAIAVTMDDRSNAEIDYACRCVIKSILSLSEENTESIYIKIN